MVGIIREVQESATNVLYKIDDMTGDSIIVRKWIDTDVSFYLFIYSVLDYL